MSDDASLKVELVDDVSGPSEKMGGSVGGLIGMLEKLGGVGESLQRVFEYTFGGLLEDGIEKVGEFAKEVVSGTFEMASFGQETLDTFQTITKSSTAGAEAFEAARSAAADLGLDVRDVASKMEQFMRLGFSQEQAENMVKMGADMANLGVSAEKVNGIMSALSRMQARGVLDSRAMLELAGAGVQVSSVYERLGDSLGKSQDQIKKMADAGKISAADAIQAIQKELLGKLGESAFGQKAEEDANTHLEGLLGKLKAKVADLQIGIGEAIAPALAEGLQSVSKSLDEFLKSADGKATIDALKDGLVALVDIVKVGAAHIGDFVAAVKTAWAIMNVAYEIAKDFAVGLAAIGAVLAVALIPFLPTIGTILMATVVPAFVAWAAATIAATWPILAVIAAAVAVGYAITHWGEIVDWIKGKMIEFGNWLRSFSLFDVGANMINGLVDGISGAIHRVVEAARRVASAVKDTIAGVLDMHSPSVVMAQMGEFTAEGFGQGIESGTARHVATAADSMAGAAVAPVASAGGGSSGGGGNVFHMTVNVEAAPGATRQDGERLAEGIGPGLRREMSSFLEDLALAG